MTPGSGTEERLVPLPGRGTGSASETVVAAGERRGYTVVAVAPGTFRLERSTRPTWALVVGIVLLPVFGLGLIFLRVRTNDTGVITIFEDRDGTKARVVGAVDEEIIEHLAAGPQSAGEPARRSTSPEVPTVPASPVVESPADPPERPVIGAAPSSAAAPAASTDHEVDLTVARPGRPSVRSTPVLRLADGRTFAVGGRLVLGRSPQADGANGVIVLDDPSLSKTHATFDATDRGVAVTDMHSTNGTRLATGDGTTPCPPGIPVVVPLGGTVVAGEVPIEVRGTSA